MTINQPLLQEAIFAAIIITALLVLLTQIITEVIKAALPKNADKYNALTVITAVVLTVLVFLAYLSIKGLIIRWYYIFGAGIYGFVVAYGAMVGYDKLIKRIFTAIKDAINNYNKIKELNDEK